MTPWVCCLVGLALVIIIWALVAYNSFVKLDNKAREAFSTMDVYLKKRWDLVPNLAEVVKGYARHEKDTLADIVKLRSEAYESMAAGEKIETNQKLTQDINTIMALAEAYPELKADKNFRDLSLQLEKVEDEIANSRKYYNGTVRMFNTKIETFPNNIFAKVFGFKPKEMFETSARDRQSVKVDLGEKAKS